MDDGKKVVRRLISYDFVEDIRDEEVMDAARKWAEENQGKYDVINPDWDRIRETVNGDGESAPKTALFEDNSPSSEEATEFIGGYWELIHAKSGAQLIVDEIGVMKELPINPIGSQLYGAPVRGPVIVLKGKAKWT